MRAAVSHPWGWTATGLQLLLLNHILDKSPLIHGDAMLLFELISIVIEEGLIASHLISDGQEAYLIDSLFDAHGLDGEEELFRDIEDLLGEVCPLTLRLYKSLPSVLLFLLKDQIVLL